MITITTPFEALMKAIEMLGGQSAMARLCELKQPSVWKWTRSSKRIPAEYVLRVEAATGVSRHDLRPDIYPRDHSASPTDAEPSDDCEPILTGLDLACQSNRMPAFDRRPEAA
ncbi:MULTISPECIES: transcriptional regulator [unclassified Sphingobium]|uniref:transcriptional regulator n=2 Tax=Sphingobium TaxID=165695 RepID=UPI0015EB3C7A|nr:MULTISPECIES: helix-turn-helix domain-containing protein [unclassified Sphingobium]MCW2407871.1 DNA-binding transcriptional regulator YdaS (Cro superfamily) [Sphingobium xanthum]